MGNADEYSHEGKPKIPYIPCRIIFPSEKEIESVTIERSGKAVYDNSYFIEPGEKGISPSDSEYRSIHT